MEKIKFKCDKDLSDISIVSELLNSDGSSLSEYLEMDGIRSGQLLRETNCFYRHNIKKVWQIAELSFDSEDKEKRYDTYLPSTNDKGIIRFCLENLLKNSSLIHMGMTQEELKTMGVPLDIDSELNLCFGKVFEMISDDPDAKFELVRHLNKFIKERKR